ncbi:Uncharacterized protein Adt_12443 [Abeliophyllum distichum]|uniref:Uncharacterized protein n=1 Tax=Abeliophyllum distichum TaxID=126358 RepID=A0ABD1UQU1_9LAMI
MSQTYNMLPVVVTVYNLPPWLYMKPEYIILTLLIPGSKVSDKDMDVLLQPSVDRLQELWSNGIDTRDAGTNNRSLFIMHVALLYTVNDFPVRNSLSGYMACPTYNEKTSSVRVIGDTSFINDEDLEDDTHEEYEDEEICSESNKDDGDDNEDQTYHDSDSD